MKISTFFIIAGIVIISFYALIEVNYYSATQTINQQPGDTPYIIIPEIGVDEPINNKSIDYGIIMNPNPPNQVMEQLFYSDTAHYTGLLSKTRPAKTW
jgi:hypothetical protein